MRVTLDDQPCATTAGSVGEAVAEAAVAAEERGRVVVEVVVDGRTLSQEELAAGDLRDADAELVSISTADLSELVAETLVDSSAALTEADSLQRRAADLIQGNRAAQALDELAEAIRIWTAVREAIVKVSDAMAIDLDSVRVGEQSIHDVLTRLGEHLKALRSALETDDPVGLSDTLLYDMPEVVGEWRELLETLHERVRSAAPPAERGP